MTDFQVFRKLQIVEEIFNASKAIAISFGAKEESFLELDANLKKLKDEYAKKVSGGIVSDTAKDNQVDSGEYIAKHKRVCAK